MKALQILYTLISSGNDDVFANKNNYEKLTFIAEAIEEAEELQNRSCDNCKKGFDCPIFRKLWKEKLRKEGYLMSRKEFDCRFWESINENISYGNMKGKEDDN